jgi:hypothetical protein
MVKRIQHIGTFLHNERGISLRGMSPMCSRSSIHLQKIFFLRSIGEDTMRTRMTITAAALLAAAMPFGGLAHPGLAQEKAKAATPPPAASLSVLPRPDFHFPGNVGRTYLDSDSPQFPQLVQAPKGAPNVVLIRIPITASSKHVASWQEMRRLLASQSRNALLNLLRDLYALTPENSDVICAHVLAPRTVPRRPASPKAQQQDGYAFTASDTPW